MLRQRARLIAWSLHACDLAVVTTAFLSSYWLRNQYFSEGHGSLHPLGQYLGLLVPVLLVWSGSLVYFCLYDSYRLKPLWVEPWLLVKAALTATLLTSLIIFLFKLQFVSRIFIALFGGVSLLGLILARMTIRSVAKRVRRKGFNSRNIVVVGTGRRARELAKLMTDHAEWGLRVLGLVSDAPVAIRKRVGPYPLLGNVESLLALLDRAVVDEVIFAVSRKKLEDLEDLFLRCQERGIRTRIALNMFPHMTAKMGFEEFSGIPFLTFTTTPPNETALAVKRLFDLVAAAVALVVLSPIFGAVAVAIKLTSTGPVLFKQTRVSMNGRLFRLYKFRTMVSDAEAIKKDLLHLNEMEGPAFKLEQDPRVTPIGRWLRKWSLDELPQLINVLRGDMSIVGPRPPLPEEVEKYEPWQRRRLSMRPGLTCLWQIGGRNRIKTFDEWMKLDLQYIDNWSLGLDLKICLRTIPVVLFGRGAY